MYVRDWSQDFEILFKLYFYFLRQFSIFYQCCGLLGISAIQINCYQCYYVRTCLG